MIPAYITKFLETCIAYIMAVVLAWKLLLSRKRVKRDDENGNFLEEGREFMDEESPSPPPPPAMGPSSVLGLLATDDLPSTDSSGEDRPPPPPPSLLMTQLPPFLHTINEEESDELRSVSSASFASPRTVIESAVSDSDYRSPEARSPADFVQADLSEPESPRTVVEGPFTEEEKEEKPVEKEEETRSEEEKQEEKKEEKKEEAPKAEEEELVEDEEEEERPPSVKELVEETGDLLKELARLGQGTVPRPPLPSETAVVESSAVTPERTIMSQVAREMQMIDGGEHHETATYQGGDRDRDQEEETVVYNEQRRKTISMDDTASLNSVSINLNATKESALNQSITSQPHDESSIMETTIIRKDRPPFRPPSPPNDLPPPPPDLQARAGPPSHPPPPPPPPEEQHPSPVRPAPPPPSILSTSALLAKAQEMTSGDAARRSFKPYDRSDQGMSSPPNEPPPPPPPLSSSAFAYKSGFSSREDLLDGGAPPSRSTVREIPVQRAPSAAPSAQSTVLDYRMPSSYVPPANDMQDEYYRREVISRTIITRSTEALSQQPPLGRSSPIERYITYPDPNTREERSVDYRITHTRNIEEEERRIREEQDRRRQEEEDRRRREDESRRLWEQREREVLDRLRRERELREIEAERTLTERERAEKDRIERDRAERERAERQRREDWERMEAERRAIEEGELERRRQLELEKLAREREEIERRERERLEKERERLERERLEAERREQERLEKIRIERERIERERLEIERIERIKRERIERERVEQQKRKEEEERLRREKEELERIERERRELEIRERELKEIARREAEERERQRLEDEMRERKRREDERAEQELLRKLEIEAAERERLRKLQERDEHERLERIRREQQRIEMEKAEADRRERERMEEERREKELLEAQKRAKEMRELQRLEDIERERLLQEEERRERERREEARRAAADRERQRRAEEEAERMRLADLERAAAQRRAARIAEQDRDRQREELDREARLVAERERLENERRAREREEEERSLALLKEKERRNQEIRDRERAEAAEREAARRADDRRSRDKLDHIVRERTEREKFEIEKRRLLAEKEAMNKKKYGLTSPETLAKLTRPAYFSRENLSQPEVTTKVERQVIERVDRNVWVDDIRVPSTTYQQQYSVDTTDDRDRDQRLYNPHERNGSARGSRYRIQRARQQFFSTDSSADPEPLPPSSRLNRSTEDISLRAKPEYRGPLLTKFHDSEFKSRTDLQNKPYPHVAPGDAGKEFERLLEETERKYAAYRYRNSQPSLHSRSRNVSATYIETDVDTGRPDVGTSTARIEETNLDDVHRRSGSVVDYNRMSRRDVHDTTVIDHTRSRSADYLMDRRLREETEPPENNLQKAMEHSPRESRMSEHEMRFRKSTEKLTVPDWYRENRPTARPTDLDNTMPRIPTGMFDKYAGELTDLRRSRQSLLEASTRQIEPPSPKPRKSLSQEVITQVETRAMSPRALPGYTVSEIPTTWMEHVTTSKTSKVVEVADTFVGPKQMIDQYGNVSMRYGGRVTIEEVLDTIFQQTPGQAQAHPYDSSFSLPQADGVYQGNADGPGIYTQNYMLMDKVMREPEKAENLLKSEDLFVRCAHCHRTRELKQARIRFVSCKHCYTYYCSRQCRVNDWPVHTGRCSFARINTLCKDVIMKVREDPKAQAEMSRIARSGFDREGRGSVNIRLASPQLAQSYVIHGWDALGHIPNRQLLHYYTVTDLVRERKEPSLIALCRRYDPREKFILSVSIIADIEHCPQTPPPETVEYADGGWQQVPQQPQSIYNPYSPLTLVPTDV